MLAHFGQVHAESPSCSRGLASPRGLVSGGLPSLIHLLCPWWRVQVGKAGCEVVSGEPCTHKGLAQGLSTLGKLVMMRSRFTVGPKGVREDLILPESCRPNQGKES